MENREHGRPQELPAERLHRDPVVEATLMKEVP
jgi:hypothetical protein